MRGAMRLAAAPVLSLALAAVLFGCGAYSAGGARASRGPEPSPPWEAVGETGARHLYRYYPQVKVYYDIKRKVYFYFADGQWVLTSTLPAPIKATGGYVELEMGEGKPYIWHEEVEKRYPPK